MAKSIKRKSLSTPASIQISTFKFLLQIKRKIRKENNKVFIIVNMYIFTGNN